jgi:hypothetical protein
MHWLVYHVLLFATSSAVYCEGLSSTKEAYSFYFAIEKERIQSEREERELANETS